MNSKKIYIAIDLKSFYASVECTERSLDPLTTNLVVADPSRTEKTICLAVSPTLKSLGIPGRARLFEVLSKIKQINSERREQLFDKEFLGASSDAIELSFNKNLAIDFIVAPPRMSLYLEYSTRIYKIYLKHVAPEDIHVYSIDEVFIDATPYLRSKNMTPREFAKMLITDILDSTGITATAGIGTNLFLCKVAMDITAKHITENENGVRIAELDEMSYRRTLWDHRPLTDFWRVGRSYANTLESHGLYTMGDIARCSLKSEDLLYRLFGVNAELLIDHAWGWEPCTINDIKSYKPSNNSLSSGQVLQHPYNFEKTKIVVREMTDMLVLDLVEKGLVTDQIVLIIGYDTENLSHGDAETDMNEVIVNDYYGRRIPKHTRCNVNWGMYTSSTRLINEKVLSEFENKASKKLSVRRITVTACNVISESEAMRNRPIVQLDLFTDNNETQMKSEAEKEEYAREKRKQKALIEIKNKYGKNAILKGTNFEDGATAKDRNNQIGGHRK